VFNISEALSELTGFPVKAGNDANVAALGEYWKGGGQGCNNMVFATLGTGVGGGIVIDGHLLHGAHGSAVKSATWC
jgi:glucokinase